MRPLTLAAAGGFLASVFALGCSQLPLGAEDDWEKIERLEKEAKAIAKTTGCEQDGQCRSAPVGSRACGGPRYYLPYCPLTTDSVALYQKLEEVAKAEQAYNRKNNLASTCEFRMPPTVGIKDGRCAAVAGANGAE